MIKILLWGWPLQAPFSTIFSHPITFTFIQALFLYLHTLSNSGTHTHTLRGNSRFSISPKDTSTRRLSLIGTRPPTFWATAAQSWYSWGVFFLLALNPVSVKTTLHCPGLHFPLHHPLLTTMIMSALLQLILQNWEMRHDVRVVPPVCVCVPV